MYCVDSSGSLFDNAVFLIDNIEWFAYKDDYRKTTSRHGIKQTISSRNKNEQNDHFNGSYFDSNDAASRSIDRFLSDHK